MRGERDTRPGEYTLGNSPPTHTRARMYENSTTQNFELYIILRFNGFLFSLKVYGSTHASTHARIYKIYTFHPRIVDAFVTEAEPR
jgi:hypothetical protein